MIKSIFRFGKIRKKFQDLFIYLFIYLSIYLFIYLFIYFINGILVRKKN